MNDEKKQFRDVCIKVLIICLCGALYSLGGAEFGWGKWLRRIAMPLILAGGSFWFSRDWRSLLTAPLVGIGCSLGYGGTDLKWLSILKRTYCGLVLGGGSTITDWLNKRFLIAVFQTVLVTVGMVLLGSFNPLPDARTEEFAIGILIALLPMLSARRKT